MHLAVVSSDSSGSIVSKNVSLDNQKQDFGPCDTS